MTARNSGHKAARPLLSPPSAALADSLVKAVAAIEKSTPLTRARLKELPLAVRDLSRTLTEERGDLARQYWASPRLASAYLRYFLPWNLLRLAWLLPGLDIPLREGARILDAGSGPLTLPLALWCALPEIRDNPLVFICSDISPRALELGRRVFAALTGGLSPWRIQLLRAPVDKALRAHAGGNLDAVLAGNMLNELCAKRGASGDEALAGRMSGLAGQMEAALRPGGRLLLLEPGARLGGKLIALARAGGLLHGLKPLAPCTHAGPCPMASGSVDGGSSARPGRPARYGGWCHFIHPARDAPASLRALAEEAGLAKESLALSCLLMGKPDGAAVLGGGAGRAAPNGPRSGFLPHDRDDLDGLEALFDEIMAQDGPAEDPERGAGKTPGGPAPAPDRRPGKGPGRAPDRGRSGQACPALPARIISAPIALPGRDRPARYACCERGLALLLDAAALPSGSRVEAEDAEGRDAKSGAFFLRRKHRTAPRS